jgi:hypothetical protein
MMMRSFPIIVLRKRTRNGRFGSALEHERDGGSPACASIRVDTIDADRHRPNGEQRIGRGRILDERLSCCRAMNSHCNNPAADAGPVEAGCH